jgi:hypothetical protein
LALAVHELRYTGEFSPPPYVGGTYNPEWAEMPPTYGEIF